MTIDPDIRQLRYFEAVARRRSFSAAAGELHISQQGLSQQVKKLESQLGVVLLERNSRGVELTPAGETLLAESRKVIRAAERATRRVLAADAGELELRLGFTLAAGAGIVPRLLALAARSRPEVRIRSREIFAPDLPAALLDDRIDLAVAPREGWPDGIASAALRAEPLVLAVGEDHPLAARERVAVADLASERLQLWPREMAPGYYDAVVAACRASGFEPEVDDSSGGSPVWAQLAGGESVALIAASQAESLRADVVAIRLDDPVPAITFSLLWRSRERDRALVTAREQLLELAARAWSAGGT